jgi:hypothetical protein
MRRLSVLLGIVGLLAWIGVANAHTTSIGYVPGGTPGSVTFWTGSYSHGGTPVNEGTATLTGVSVVYNQVVSFDIPPVGTKPVGLVDGTNNFYWCNDATFSFPCSTDGGIGGGVVWWQGVTFTGLTPGTYTFSCGGTCGVTAQWDTLPGASGSVTVNLTGVVIGGGPTEIPTVSEWGLILTALLLLAAGIFALRLRPR